MLASAAFCPAEIRHGVVDIVSEVNNVEARDAVDRSNEQMSMRALTRGDEAAAARHELAADARSATPR
jgi:hypothetical protein